MFGGTSVLSLKDEYDETLELVNTFFNDLEKSDTWMKTSNPLLGNISPLTMIACYRGKKLLKWIRIQLDENRRITNVK